MPVSPSPSKATVDPPSGAGKPSLEEKLNTPPAFGDCAVKLHVPSVGSNPLPVIVPYRNQEKISSLQNDH